MGQLEFIDIRRERTRPAGAGEKIDGFFVFAAEAQRTDQVAYTLLCDPDHVLHLIHAGEFPSALDISMDTARRACWRIPREDVLAFLDARKTGI